MRQSPDSETSCAPFSAPLDLLVLLCIGVFLVLAPPDLQYLSYRWGLRLPLSGDALGGAFTGLVTLLLLAYFMVSATGHGTWPHRLQVMLVAILAGVCVGLPTVSDILARRDRASGVPTGQVSRAHDGGVLQTEAAIGFLLKGESPYSADYSRTEMALGVDSRPELWHSLGFEENPAFHFYPYPPLTILFSLPFDLLCHAVLGRFDQRIVYLLAWVVLAVLGYSLPSSPEWRLPLMTLLAFNPLSAPYFVIGRNDVLCQTFLIAMVLLLARGRYGGASLLLGLACGVKQFAWLMVPFYLVYLYAYGSGAPGPARQEHRPHAPSQWKTVARRSWSLFAALAIVYLPFLLWDPGGLLHGLLVGQGALYPFRSEGLGVANFLILFQAVRTPRDAFPLVVFQVLIVLPVGVYGLWRVLQRPAVSTTLVGYAATLLLFLFFSRHFAQNYLVVVFSMMAAAWAVAHDERPCCRRRRGP